MPPTGCKKPRRALSTPPRLSLLAVVALLLMAGLGIGASGAEPATPSAPAASLEAANKLYEQGKFADAAAAYEALALTHSLKVSPALLFNLGNAQFKAGAIGRAIVAYRSAGALSPRDPDVRANLQFARNQVEGPTLRPSSGQRWLQLLTVNEWTGLTMAAFWCCFLLLAAGELRPAWKRRLRTYALVSGGAAALLTVCLVLSLQSLAEPLAVVVGREAVVRNGPLDESPSAFTVHDGAELRVRDTKDDWLQVTDGQQRLGWIKRSSVLTSGVAAAPTPGLLKN